METETIRGCVCAPGEKIRADYQVTLVVLSHTYTLLYVYQESIIEQAFHLKCLLCLSVAGHLPDCFFVRTNPDKVVKVDVL